MSFIIDKVWYAKHPLAWILFPLSVIYALFSYIRRWYLEFFCQKDFPVPIIVVGNISVGGVGKTPLVIELAKKIRAKGLKVGIVSRGYKAKIEQFPYQVQQNDSAEWVGDEPLLIAQKTNCPVIIAPKRNQAVAYLLKHHQVQIILSDDGLQHYRMGRTIEIAVVDGLRGLGNGCYLPAGPLRESPARLDEVDYVVVNEGRWPNAFSMSLIPGNLIHMASNTEVQACEFKEKIAAVAAIGNPQRFYSTLTQLGLEFESHSYPDHYSLGPQDLEFSESLIVMTEKDAVKCRSFHSDKLYYLPVEAKLSKDFWDALWSHNQLKGLFI